MAECIRILHVDDHMMDRELVQDALREGNSSFKVTEIASREGLETHLVEGGYDLVLTDVNVLGFEGLQILDVIRATCPHMPVVILTSHGSEEAAAEAIKRGACDYVVKSPRQIQRLPNAILEAMNQHRAEEERRWMEDVLRENETKFRLLYEEAPLAYQALDTNGHIIDVNRAWLDMLGYTREEVIDRCFGDFLPAQNADSFQENFSRFKAAGEKHGAKFTMVRKDGSQIIVSFDGKVGYGEGGISGRPIAFWTISPTRCEQWKRCGRARQDIGNCSLRYPMPLCFLMRRPSDV